MKFSTISGIFNVPGVPDQKSFILSDLQLGLPTPTLYHLLGDAQWLLHHSIWHCLAFLWTQAPEGYVLFMVPLNCAFCEMFHPVLPPALGLSSSDFPPVPQSSSFSFPARIPPSQYLSWNSSVAQRSTVSCLYHLTFSQVPVKDFTAVFHTESCSPHSPIFTASWMLFPPLY